VTPVLTTNLRSTQTLDPTGVARLGANEPVTAAAYPVCATSASSARPSTTTGSWTIGLEAMPKVDFHDRWPLHSTS
jgi:hypothetical protein